MVATAAGEKLLVGCCPVRNWTDRIIQACFCAENICSYENQQKLLPPVLHFLTPICTKSFVGGVAHSPPDLLAVFRVPTSRQEGRGEEERSGKKRGQEGREGVRPLKRKVGAYVFFACSR